MIGKVRGTPSEEEFLKALKCYDYDNTGRISTIELKHMLRTLGEILNANEINQLIKEADPKNEGTFDYRVFAKKIYAVG